MERELSEKENSLVTKLKYNCNTNVTLKNKEAENLENKEM